MLKLYGGARSRASIVQWYLEELGLEYEFVMLDFQAGENRQEPFLAINPMGKVPAIVDGDFVLWESGAILGYLATKYCDVTNIQESALLDQWIDFANSTLSSAMAMKEASGTSVPRMLDGLEAVLSKNEFLLGEDFSAADVAVGSMLYYGPLLFGLSLSEHEAVRTYSEKLQSRAAFQTVFASR
ncbi:MAG: glutathione S-transferase family protein [Geitlerinemataceae cyanobacterium]